MRIVVGGYVAPFPSAGLFWHYAQYVLGFQALGHEVWYLEDSGDHPWGWDLARNVQDDLCAHGCAWLAREMAELGLADRWVFRHVPSGRHSGMDAATTGDVLAGADLLVNVSCVLTPRPEYARIPVRIAVDTDPVFTQIKVAAGVGSQWVDFAEAHTRLFTFGRPPLPAQWHEWLPTRQPVCLDRWKPTPPPPGGALTTVASWQSYPPLTWEGRSYGTKGQTLAAFDRLPAAMPCPVEVALGPGSGADAGAAQLREGGWRVADGAATSVDSAAYRRFIDGSLGEIGLAKHGYVAGRSGWFSERTCAYLASGRPAVVQDTGWSDWLPTGKGLFAFSTAEEAAAGAAEILADPAGHGRAARRLAEDHFDARDVLADLLERSL